jgi:hypothetical protein
MATRLIYLCGVIIAGTMVAVTNVDPRVSPLAFYACLITAGASYMLVVWLLPRRRLESRWALVFCLGLAALSRLPLLLSPPILSTDIYRYVWDGRLQHLGYNPYTLAPSDPAIAHLHNQETKEINHPGLPTPYPPVAELFFRNATIGNESARAIKTALEVCDVLIVIVLVSPPLLGMVSRRATPHAGDCRMDPGDWRQVPPDRPGPGLLETGEAARPLPRSSAAGCTVRSVHRSWTPPDRLVRGIPRLLAIQCTTVQHCRDDCAGAACHRSCRRRRRRNRCVAANRSSSKYTRGLVVADRNSAAGSTRCLPVVPPVAHAVSIQRGQLVPRGMDRQRVAGVSGLGLGPATLGDRPRIRARSRGCRGRKASSFCRPSQFNDQLSRLSRSARGEPGSGAEASFGRRDPRRPGCDRQMPRMPSVVLPELCGKAYVAITHARRDAMMPAKRELGS